MHFIKKVILLIIIALQCSWANSQNLDYFINQGLTYSPVLKDIGNQINSNSYDSLLVKANQTPQVNLNSMAYYAPVVRGYGYSEALTNTGSLASVVSVSQKIFNGNTIKAQYSKYGYQNQALKISSKISEIDLKKSITLQYIAATSLLNDLEFRNLLLLAAKDEEAALKQMVIKGVYKQVDYLTFMVEYKEQELVKKDLDIQYQQTISDLHILCGISDTNNVHLEEPNIALNTPVDIQNSPFYNRFVIDSLKIQNEKLLINRNYKPNVSWVTDAGLVNNLPSEIPKNFGFSVGLALTVPIYDGHQRALNHKKLQLEENTRASYADYYKLQRSKQLQQLYYELAQTQAIEPEIKQQIDLTESVLKLNKSTLNSGSTTILDYVVAIKNFISVKRAYNQNILKTQQLITEINYCNQ